MSQLHGSAPALVTVLASSGVVAPDDNTPMTTTIVSQTTSGPWRTRSCVALTADYSDAGSGCRARQTVLTVELTGEWAKLAATASGVPKTTRVLTCTMRPPSRRSTTCAREGPQLWFGISAPLLSVAGNTIHRMCSAKRADRRATDRW